MSDNDCRATLIAVATPLFAEKGFHGVSVRELVKGAGMNLSMISYYFGGKEALYAAVLAEQFATLGQVADIRELPLDPLGKFQRYIRATVDRYRKNPYLLRFYTSELTNPTPSFELIVKPAIREVLLVLEEIFREGIATGQFCQELDPMDTILALAGMINFYFLLEPVTRELVDRPPERDEILVTHLMDIFTRGVVIRNL
jgi:TetR/AcrR family transcriptional regulator